MTTVFLLQQVCATGNLPPSIESTGNGCLYKCTRQGKQIKYPGEELGELNRPGCCVVHPYRQVRETDVCTLDYPVCNRASHHAKIQITAISTSAKAIRIDRKKKEMRLSNTPGKKQQELEMDWD